MAAPLNASGKCTFADMRKHMVTDCRNVDGLRKCYDCSNEFFFLNLKYYGTFTFITQIVHSYAHVNPLKGILSDKSLIIAQTYIFNSWTF